jgi:tRNA G18 (ribose-2'-O)-methylase SpoU
MEDFYLILDNIRSLENVGSIFRTADALGINKIYLGGISGILKQGTKLILNPRVAKTALGAENKIPFEHNFQTWRIIKKLKKQGIKIYALEQAENSVKILNFKPKFPLALVLGNEIEGISRSISKKCDGIIEIPMLGSKESLNVAVAFGIAGYQINQKRKF